MTKYIYAKQFFFPEEIKGPGYLPLLDSGHFGDYQTQEPQGEILDYGAYSIAPGLVDTHIHGYRGHDIMDNSLEGLREISAGLPASGVTSYLPTTLTASHQDLELVCETIGQNAHNIKGAKIQGIFLEGPFFNPIYKGAQNPKFMSDPLIQQLDTWQDKACGLVKKIALAPERQGALKFIKQAKDRGIYTAIAHTDANFDDCYKAVQAGASIFVHTYNAMKGLHHREPGVVGAALTLGQFNELICDGHHVHPVSAQIVMQASGPDKTVLITDCMRAGGLGDGPSRIGEFEVIVQDGQARLKDSGNLAGSVLELIQAVQNLVKWELASPAQALAMASLNPATSVGIDHLCGKLDKGYPADFIVLNDALELQATYIDGQLCFSSN